jgi:hypothetical protein
MRALFLGIGFIYTLAVLTVAFGVALHMMRRLREVSRVSGRVDEIFEALTGVSERLDRLQRLLNEKRSEPGSGISEKKERFRLPEGDARWEETVAEDMPSPTNFGAMAASDAVSETISSPQEPVPLAPDLVRSLFLNWQRDGDAVLPPGIEVRSMQVENVETGGDGEPQNFFFRDIGGVGEVLRISHVNGSTGFVLPHPRVRDKWGALESVLSSFGWTEDRSQWADLPAVEMRRAGDFWTRVA